MQIPTVAEAKELELEAQVEFESIMELRSCGWFPPIFIGHFDPYEHDALLFDLEPLRDYYANVVAF